MFLAGIGGLGAPELLIILVIVVVLFGAGRLAGIGSALGQSIKEFRKASRDPEEEERERRAEERRRAEEAGRYTATGATPPATNGTGISEYRPGSSTPEPAPTPAPPARPPDFTGRP